MAGTPHDDFDFSSLSLKDLIEARDLYHFHLMSKANVVGTAVGLYLIRDKEDWPRARGEGARPRHKLTYARTFANSQVRDYSWPCILVLVRDWVDESEFGRAGKPKPSEIVPKRLYLPDGRIVPVCTVLAPPLPQRQRRIDLGEQLSGDLPVAAGADPRQPAAQLGEHLGAGLAAGMARGQRVGGVPVRHQAADGRDVLGALHDSMQRQAAAERRLRPGDRLDGRAVLPWQRLREHRTHRDDPPVG